MKHLPAGDERFHPRASHEDVGNQRTGCNNLLEVVKAEKHAARTKHAKYSVLRPRVATRLQSEREGNRGRDLCGITNRRKRNDRNAIVKSLCAFACNSLRE